MARDMFYNYDHHLNRKDYLQEEILDDDKKLNSFTDMQIIYNIKGEYVGVSCKKGAPIKLYFVFDGDIDGDIDILGYLEDFKFSIVDVLHEVLISEEDAVITRTENFNEIEIYIPSEKNTLKHDVYRMMLDCTIDGENYTLFSEADGILEVI